MFNQSSLATLMDATPAHGVSIFMPTHMRGSEIRQDPIRLKNLATEARGKLMAAGLSQADADGLLAVTLLLTVRLRSEPREWKKRELIRLPLRMFARE